jgi:hypothetical protein
MRKPAAVNPSKAAGSPGGFLLFACMPWLLQHHGWSG